VKRLHLWSTSFLLGTVLSGYLAVSFIPMKIMGHMSVIIIPILEFTNFEFELHVQT
jgi:hypothetical protein